MHSKEKRSTPCRKMEQQPQQSEHWVCTYDMIHFNLWVELGGNQATGKKNQSNEGKKTWGKGNKNKERI